MDKAQSILNNLKKNVKLKLIEKIWKTEFAYLLYQDYMTRITRDDWRAQERNQIACYYIYSTLSYRDRLYK